MIASQFRTTQPPHPMKPARSAAITPAQTPVAYFRASALALVAALSFTSANADIAYSPPVGGMTVTIAAGTGAAPLTTSFSVPLLDIPAASGATTGAISSVTASTITVANANWTAGGLVLTGFPYAVRITSGQAAGLTVTISGNTSDTLTVGSTGLLTLGVVPGDTFTLIPVDTLNTLLGSNTVLGGANPTDADIVTLSSSSQLSYYYNTTLGRWVRTSGPTTDRGTTPIPPDTVVSITRKSTALPLVFTGRVPASRAMIAVGNSGSTYTNTGFPTSVTLGSLAMQTRIAGWVSNASAANADLLGVNSGGSWLYYFHNGTNWQRTSGPTTNRDSVAISAGSAIQIFKTGVTAGTTYFIRDLPYTL